MALPLKAYQNVIVATALLALVTGCQGLTAARVPAPIHYVAIEDGVSDTDLQTKAGEEVRWINVRTAPVAVIFPGPMNGDLSCTKGFKKDEAARMTAIIFPDDYASLCFSEGGRQTYRVLDASRQGVELNHEVTVEVIEAR